MEGLEISIISFNTFRNTYRMRLDSEYYLKIYLNNEKYLKDIPLKKYLKGNIKNINSLKLKKNFNYISISDVNSNGLIYYSNVVDYNEIPDRATYILKNDDIAVSTVRPNRNAVAFIKNPIRLIGTSGFTILRIDNEKISPNLIYVFCKTKYFITKLMRENTATMYPAVTDIDVKNVKIKNFNLIFIKFIDKLINKCYENNFISKNKYNKAEQLLLEELNLKDFNLSKEPVNVKSFKDSFNTSGRLDAEYYQKKYEKIEEHIQSYKGGYSTLNKVCNLKDKNFMPDDKKIYKYLELSNIGNNGEVNGYTEEHGINLPTRARRLINTNDVIISSIEGSLSSCALIHEEYNNCICSNGFYVINSNEINSETLLIYFKNKIIQSYLKKHCSGTILTSINKIDFERILIPYLDKELQQEIANLVEESFKLRKQSEQLLEIAKTAVEKAIETDETQATDYINHQLKLLNIEV